MLVYPCLIVCVGTIMLVYPCLIVCVQTIMFMLMDASNEELVKKGNMHFFY
jgi:hypothetical protein